MGLTLHFKLKNLKGLANAEKKSACDLTLQNFWYNFGFVLIFYNHCKTDGNSYSLLVMTHEKSYKNLPSSFISLIWEENPDAFPNLKCFFIFRELILIYLFFYWLRKYSLIF